MLSLLSNVSQSSKVFWHKSQKVYVSSHSTFSLQDHLLSALIAGACFLPFLFSNSSHEGFEDIEYSFVPLFEWFLRQFDGDFTPVNFLWELGWSAPLAHGAWTFPGNLLLEFISAKTYFFLFYSVHLYLCFLGFIGISKLYNSSRTYAVMATLLLSFLPPQGWYIFVHEAPTVLASLQLVPLLVYLTLKLSKTTSNEKIKRQCFWYYNILLGLTFSYLLTMGHPGMFYSFLALPAIVTLILILRSEQKISAILKNLSPAIIIALFFSFPKLIAYWDTFSIQSSNAVERVFYNANPSRHENFWVQALLFPYNAISKINTESAYHLYFYLTRYTRYLPFLWVIFIFSAFISWRTFFAAIACLLATIGLQYLFMQGVRLGSSGANHFFEGLMATILIIAVVQAPKIYTLTLPNRILRCGCILLSVFFIFQQFGFKKHPELFFNFNLLDAPYKKSLLLELKELDIDKGDRIIMTNKFESHLRKQKLRHRYVHATSFSSGGIANVSMFGKSASGEPIYKSFRQGYSFFTLNILRAHTNKDENIFYYLKALGIKGILDINKKDRNNWTLIDKKRNAVFRRLDDSRSYKTQTENSTLNMNKNDNLSSVLSKSIMFFPNAKALFKQEYAIFTLNSLIESKQLSLPIRYSQNLHISSNQIKDITYSNCAGLTCLELSQGTKNIRVSSSLNTRYLYTLASIYLLMIFGSLAWMTIIFRLSSTMIKNNYTLMEQHK